MYGATHFENSVEEFPEFERREQFDQSIEGRNQSPKGFLFQCPTLLENTQ